MNTNTLCLRFALKKREIRHRELRPLLSLPSNSIGQCWRTDAYLRLSHCGHQSIHLSPNALPSLSTNESSQSSQTAPLPLRTHELGFGDRCTGLASASGSSTSFRHIKIIKPLFDDLINNHRPLGCCLRVHLIMMGSIYFYFQFLLPNPDKLKRNVWSFTLFFWLRGTKQQSVSSVSNSNHYSVQCDTLQSSCA